jgi:pilus assembly protein FimV
MLLLSGTASAIGLGELRGQPALGERIGLEINLLGAEKLHLDAACFRLVQPASQDDLPWLKKASLSVRKGSPPVLEIRSEVPLREPILQVAVRLGCGHEVSRDYIVMASPATGIASPVAEPRMAGASGSSGAEAIPPVPPMARRSPKVRSAVSADVEAAPRVVPKRSEKRSVAAMLPDRLFLSDGTDVGEPSLRLATRLLPVAAEAKDFQREILRLEYRMLMAMNEQAVSQMAAAEKLRNMEGTLGELQQRAADFVQRVEENGAASAGGMPGLAGQPAAQVNQAPASEVSAKPASKEPPVKIETARGNSAWGFYGALLGAVLGLAGWFGWRSYRERNLPLAEVGAPIDVPELRVDPQRAEEHEDQGGVDLPFEPAVMGISMPVDVELDAGELVGQAELPEKAQARGADSVLSISATALDEHFEANPVMELADIMLSFGRVKGAAQALQEFIDHNPQEALQPWIRLMDVYRMAGMRAEFENVARNLNQHFNVEIQNWDIDQFAMVARYPDGEEEIPVAPRPQSLEDLPRLMNMVVELWDAGDVVGYLFQLLRDNRGGQRHGFALAVVEDIMFLIELKETANRMVRA